MRLFGLAKRMPKPNRSHPRARRFAMHQPVQFRGAGERQWSSAVTENVSCTGLLLRGSRMLDVATPVVVEMPAPPPLCGNAKFKLRCEGRVVRQVASPHAGPPALAVAIQSVTIDEAQAPAPKLREMLHDVNRQLALVVGNADLLVAHGDAALTSRLQEVKRAALAAAAIIQKIPM